MQACPASHFADVAVSLQHSRCIKDCGSLVLAPAFLILQALGCARAHVHNIGGVIHNGTLALMLDVRVRSGLSVGVVLRAIRVGGWN